MAEEVRSGKHSVRAVAPAAPHHLAYLEFGDLIAECIDLADLGVTPHINGIVKRGLTGPEERRLGIPLLLKIRVGASIHRQFGAGRDAGIERADPNLARTRLRRHILAYLDDSWSGQLDDVRHQAALWARAVVRRANSEIRELS